VSAGDGELALVLHTHMPYVEGYGTWPFGEEWLWEAMATSYLPLLDVLDEGAPVTLSLTPVLCDQLEAPGIGERFLAFLRDVRPASHELDIHEHGNVPGVVAELRRSAADYERAAERFSGRGGDLLGAFAPHAAWTSSATHAVLPLLATDAGIRLQLQAGIDAHRARFDATRPWHGGFWSPECAYGPWLDTHLDEAGVRATCVDLTDVLGPGAPEHLRPLATEAGVTLAPIDRAIVELVWSDRGYPAQAPYRAYTDRTVRDHHPWAVDGAPYDRERAAAQVQLDAADFVARARERVAGGGLSVCALDTELLGHWWFEGPQWLAAVVTQAREQGLALTTLDDALQRHEPAPPRDLPVTSWGTPRDLSTWSGPAVAEMAFAARAAELAAVAGDARPTDAAVRDLLAMQSSDWAFIVSKDLAAPYGRERAAAHGTALDEALRGVGSSPPPRNLAVHATAAPLLAP
jgi:1,4-alpha-glucan branching enzyme